MKLRLRILKEGGFKQAQLSEGHPLIDVWIPEDKHAINGGQHTGWAVLEYTNSVFDEGWQPVPVFYTGQREATGHKPATVR
jgi:hypothetical protein